MSKSTSNKSLTVEKSISIAEYKNLQQELQKFQQEREQLQQQSSAYQAVATQAASRLLQAESLLSPQLLRKPNFWNILFHFKEVIAVIKEVIKIIQEFKGQFIKQTPENTNEPAN